MTYSLLAEAFFLPTFTLSKQNKQTRRFDAVQSSHLYLGRSLTLGTGNRSSHHFSLIAVFDVTFTLSHSGASFIIFSLLANDLWAGTWILGQNKLVLWFNTVKIWLPTCLFVCLHCELPLHMLTGSFCGLGISALLSAKPSGSLKCESGNLSVRYYSDLKWMLYNALIPWNAFAPNGSYRGEITEDWGMDGLGRGRYTFQICLRFLL